MAVTIRNIRTICTAPQKVNLTVVKVETSEPGLYGLGCATFSYRDLTVCHLIDNYLKPLLVGKEVERIEEIWQLMHQNAYWRNGPIENNAISGIDMALWDIKGKMAGMPVYQLFGGKCREGVLVYRHAEGRDLQELLEKINLYQEQGITHIRCQYGGYGGTPYGEIPCSAPEGALPGVYLDAKQYLRHTVTMFEKIRSKVGYDLGLIHDVHERISPSDALWLAKELEPFDLFYLEEPIQLEQADWLEQLRLHTNIPIAHGELINNCTEWKSLISRRLIDYIRVHISQIGGITAARKLQVFAELFGVRTAWHGPWDMSPVGHAANIHMDLVAPNFGIQEWTSIPCVSEAEKEALCQVFPGCPQLRGSYVYVNEAPGLGVDIDEREAAKYPCENTITTWTQTRRKDGALQAP